VKADLRRPLTYGAVLVGLLVYRAAVWVMGKSKPRAQAETAKTATPLAL